MLEGDVEIGQYLPVCHQRDDLIHVGVRVNVVQPHPSAELAERAGEIEESRLHFASLPRACRIFEIGSVSGGVLRDDQNFLHTRANEPFGFPQHVGSGP